jgi:hypothetical protein
MPTSAKITGMAVAKRSPKQAKQQRIDSRRKPTVASSTPAPKKEPSLRELYARLKKTKPGSPESKQISEQILNAIG